MAFYSAAEKDWEKALEYTRRFLKKKGRQNARRLSAGLLEVEILHYMGKKLEAQNRLETFSRQTRDPWYRVISEGLSGKRTLDSLKLEAGNRPENLITLHTAFGFWDEGSGDKEKAIEHYKVALESFLDTWFEFDFAKGRLKQLKQATK